MPNRHLIIGAGDIGRSIAEVIDGTVEAHIRDHDSDLVGQFDYLHICFPHTSNFEQSVADYIDQYQPRTVIVHSTVPIGTIRALGKKIVHVPIRGRHPNLSASIKTFRLYVGGVQADRVQAVANFFRQFNPDVSAVSGPPETTELLKLMSTSYLAWNVLFEKEVKRLCDQHQVPFETVYTDANQSYNAGYTAMGEPQFVRPVLNHRPGPIGGHCLIPNAELLPNSYVNQLILQKNRELEAEDD